MSDGIADKFKIDGGINLAHQMVFRHQFIEGDGFKVVLLWGGVFKHGGQSVFCTDLIRSKSEIYDICHKEYRCKKERKIVTI
ncbi:Uncharacterised protein [Yersinia enterocolitica]|nr:Uncharacterised protein [Yersinia enterocolitica]